MQQLVTQAVERIVPHVASLSQQPAVDVDDAMAMARTLKEPLPEHGQPAAELLDLLFTRIIPKSFNTAGPGYLAYIPGGGIFHSAVADLVTDAVNRYMGLWLAAPGLAQLEANVIRWFCGIVGYPVTANGLLTTGGSLANFSAVVTARRERLPEQFLSGILYASDQTHHSVKKAALLAGFPERNVRAIPSDERCCVRVELLAQAIAADRAAGCTPFLIVGNAGTTNTGAVDDLRALADLARREDCWFHVDAAYGGFFMLTARGQTLMRGIERADSVTLDPHKGLFLPYGTGSLLMRDGGALKRAHGVGASYLPSTDDDPDLMDFSQMSPELSRGFRGLRVWLPLKMHGIGPFRRNLEEKLALTRWATEELRKTPGIEIVAEPQLSIVGFRVVRPGVSPEALDQLNREVLNRINARKRVYLSGTVLREQFVIRICVLSFRTHLDRVQVALEDIREVIEEMD
ncbi:MAG: decarboxylase [Deltaproteobacteria bacterium]|nr:decarboxylase [Deltaproteobacteria bacterium]